MKNYLFVDGTNLYASQYELFGPQKYLNFSKFIKEVEKKIKVKFNKIYFYASYSPKPKRMNKKQSLYIKNEGLFYRSVRNTPVVIFFKGYRSKTSGKEKEVDVKLAVDVVEKASKSEFENLYLLSGDADFMEALFAARRFGKKANVLCLENKIMYKALRFFKTYIFFFSPKGYTLTKMESLQRIILSEKILVEKI